MDEKDKLIQELQDQLQKSEELNKKSIEFIKRAKENEQIVKTWNKIRQPESEVDMKSGAFIPGK